jgi:argininosuccinate lyase
MSDQGNVTEEMREYWRSKDHRQHTPGCPQSEFWSHYMQLPSREMGKLQNLNARIAMDRAWTVMLYRQGLVSHEVAAKLLSTLKDAGEKGYSWAGEEWLKKQLGGDEDTASAVNYGRTLQEPMARMQMRDAILEVYDEAHDTMGMLLDRAEQYAAALMAGQSHFSHAQPTTYGAYLLAVHDGIARALKQLDVAYELTNQNSGGCGACSGTGWPVDRQFITELLGFDKLIELAYDCESSQDEIPAIQFALSSIALTLSRSAMDHGIWSLEEIDNLQAAPEWLGVSSFMPQKAHTGGMFENIRIACDEVIGGMMTTVVTFKGESIQDVLPVYKSPTYVLKGTLEARKALGLFRHVVGTARINTERMEEIVRNGYSGAPDLALHLIREHGYGGRRAHRICCHFVRLARERGIHPAQTTGKLLDEAARIGDEPEPKLSTDVVRDCMTFKHFFETHNNPGDAHPDQTRRLAAERRDALQALRDAQAGRRQRIAAGQARLTATIEEILSSGD